MNCRPYCSVDNRNHLTFETAACVPRQSPVPYWAHAPEVADGCTAFSAWKRGGTLLADGTPVTTPVARRASMRARGAITAQPTLQPPYLLASNRPSDNKLRPEGSSS
jgi:hypothetical protein